MKNYVIIWDYQDDKGFAHIGNELCFENKNRANAAWKQMKAAGVYLNMRHEVREIEEKPTEQMYNTVRVRFNVSGKLYTYLARSELKAGDEVVVRTAEGREILKVEWAGKQTRRQLEKELPFDRYQYISGKIVAA